MEQTKNTFRLEMQDAVIVGLTILFTLIYVKIGASYWSRYFFNDTPEAPWALPVTLLSVIILAFYSARLTIKGILQTFSHASE